MYISNGNKRNFYVSPNENNDNITINDIIGNKYDSHNCNTLFSKLSKILRFLTCQDRCYPSQSNGITINSGNSPWETSDYIEIIPINTITDNFSIRKVYVEDTSDGGCWQIDFYKGMSGDEELIGSIRQSYEGTRGSMVVYNGIDIKTKCLDANERVSCKASHSLGSETITISLGYYYL